LKRSKDKSKRLKPNRALLNNKNSILLELARARPLNCSDSKPVKTNSIPENKENPEEVAVEPEVAAVEPEVAEAELKEDLKVPKEAIDKENNKH